MYIEDDVRKTIKTFCCPRCNAANKVEVEMDGTLIGQFNFTCGECGLSFKYQYGNISSGSEMSTYKNEYTDEILKEIEIMRKKR